MSKKANPAVIGTFVLGAAILAGVAILTLGSGKMFEKTQKFVMYFEGDVGGLDVGAPVLYKGMRVGSVTEMRLEMNTDTGESLLPVYIELEENRLTFTGTAQSGKGMEYQVEERGVRGQLQSGSMITGKKQIALIEAPGTAKRLTGADPSLLEIPTLPTMTETLLNTLADLPFASIVSNLNSTLASVSALAGSSEVKGAIASVSQSAAKLDEMLTKLEDTVPALVKSTQGTAEETRKLLMEVRPAATNLGPILVSVQKRIDEFQQVEKELKETLAQAKLMLSERSPIRYELTATLERVGGAAESLRQFMDYLQRHPESLLAGKGNQNSNRSDP